MLRRGGAWWRLRQRNKYKVLNRQFKRKFFYLTIVVISLIAVRLIDIVDVDCMKQWVLGDTLLGRLSDIKILDEWSI